MNPLRIAVNGLGGTGKEGFSKGLAEYFGLERISAGNYFRDIAMRLNVSVPHLEELSLQDPAYDREVDARTEAFAMTSTRGIIEGRCAAHLLPKDKHNFRILLVCDDSERYQRIYGRNMEKRGQSIPIAEIARLEKYREKCLSQRMLRDHDVTLDNLLAEHHYDLVIDTTVPNEYQVYVQGRTFIEKKIKGL